jgi:hypothetical protein
MGKHVHRKQYLTDEEVARDEQIRRRLASRPSPAELMASGEYVGPMSIEEYLAWHKGRSDAPLTCQLQAALKTCDKSIYAIAQESGVSAPIIQRFLSGERGITLETAGKLAAYLGLCLLPATKR